MNWIHQPQISNRFELDDAIEEVNFDFEQDVENINKKYHTHNLKKLPEFVDKSDMIDS